MLTGHNNLLMTCGGFAKVVSVVTSDTSDLRLVMAAFIIFRQSFWKDENEEKGGQKCPIYKCIFVTKIKPLQTIASVWLFLILNLQKDIVQWLAANHRLRESEVTANYDNLFPPLPANASSYTNAFTRHR